MKKILLCLLIAASCANPQYIEGGKEIVLRDTERTKYVGLADIFEPLQTVCLETKDSCMLQRIEKVEVVDDCYYVLEGRGRPAVLVFDSKGRFVRRIGTQGHGKGEYVNAADFTVDQTNGRVVILSAPSKVYIYDLQGQFIKSKDLGKAYCWSVTSTDDGYVCSTNHRTYTTGDDAFLLFFFDEDFEVKEKKIPVLSHQIYTPLFLSSPFQRNNGKDYFVDNFTNKIYDLAAAEGNSNYQLCLTNPMPTEHFETVNSFAANQRKYDFLKDVLLLGEDAVFVYIQNAQQSVETASLSGDVIAHGCYGSDFPKMFSDGKGCAILCISAYTYAKDRLDGFVPELKEQRKASDNYIFIRCRLKKVSTEK